MNKNTFPYIERSLCLILFTLNSLYSQDYNRVKKNMIEQPIDCGLMLDKAAYSLNNTDEIQDQDFVENDLLILKKYGQLDSIDCDMIETLIATVPVYDRRINYTYRSILEGIAKFKKTTEYKQLREDRIKFLNKREILNAKIVNLSNWEKDKKLLLSAGIPASIIEDFKEFIRLHSQEQTTFAQAIKNYESFKKREYSETRKSEKQNPTYYLELKAKNCTVNCTLNGFPIYSFEAPYLSVFSKPINTALVGKNNVLKIDLTPIDTLKKSENLESPTFGISGSIKLYAPDELVVAPENGSQILLIDQSMKFSTYTFDNEVLSFKKIFNENEKIEDEIEIKNYAIKLVSLLKNKDTEGLLREFKPKLTDYALAFNEPDNYSDDFKNFMNTEFLPAKPIVNIAVKDVQITPHCDKRIWKIGLLDGSSLFQTEKDENGDVFCIEIFVAKINNELKVIR